MVKFITADEAALLVADGCRLGVQGMISTSIPEKLVQALAKRYKETGSPKNIKLFSASGVGDNSMGGNNALAEEGLIGELHTSHLGTVPRMQKLVMENKFPAYIVPQGVNAQLLRAIAGKKPGVFTTVGLKTYADPREEGCKVNQAAKESDREIVRFIEIDGKEYLHYLPFNIDICFIRATSADSSGNLSIEKEAIRFDQLDMAIATKNSGGIVVAQVLKKVDRREIKPHNVVVPGALVDYVVVADEGSHLQCIAEPGFHPEWCGELIVPTETLEPMKLDARKICGRRAAKELKRGYHVNLGIGIPEAVSAVAAEEGMSDDLTMSVECGVFGGIPMGGLKFGCTQNPEGIISHVNTFDIYDGGGIDLAVLGAAEIDEKGNVNVGKFNGKMVGPGGFINISQSTDNVIFVGTFTAGGGKFKKFKKKVEQITFSGEYGAETGKNVLYVTERAVFKLVKGGIELIEIAPGVELEKDILEQMEFTPLISKNLKLMDESIFIE